jgi:hypothetical protein
MPVLLSCSLEYIRTKSAITQATIWPTVLDDDDVEQSVECLAGETEVLTENLPQYLFVHHKSHMT